MYSASRYLPMTASGFSHSEISGSTPACGFPELIAANHVLHRLLAPRHPPRALSSLTINNFGGFARGLAAPPSPRFVPASKARLHSATTRETPLACGFPLPFSVAV